MPYASSFCAHLLRLGAKIPPDVYLKTFTFFSTAKLGVIDDGDLKDSDFEDDRQPEMAAETGNTYIAETTRESIEIPSANLGFIP